MLDVNDLEVLKNMIEGIVDARAQQTEARLEERIEARIHQSETFLLDELTRTQNFLLDELARTQTFLEKRIDRLQSTVDEQQKYYRIQKLDEQNTSLIFQMVDNLDHRVTALENKTVTA